MIRMHTIIPEKKHVAAFLTRVSVFTPVLVGIGIRSASAATAGGLTYVQQGASTIEATFIGLGITAGVIGVGLAAWDYFQHHDWFRAGIRVAGGAVTGAVVGHATDIVNLQSGQGALF